jgi:hypothetical protein
MAEIFSACRDKRKRAQEALPAQLSQQICPRKVEVDWGQQKLDFSPDAKRALSESEPPQRSSVRQCELFALPRLLYYYHGPGESAEHLQLLWLLDAQ